MSRVDVHPTMPTTRPGRIPAGAMAVLIEVPKVTGPWARPAVRTSGREKNGLRRPATRRPRRRLRRVVRLVGLALLALAPWVGAGALGGARLARRALALPLLSAVARTGDRDEIGGVVEASHPPDQSLASIGTPPVVVLSIEPAAGSPVTEADVPVVFPGYVLPDDSLEEPAHEGG